MKIRNLAQGIAIVGGILDYFSIVTSLATLMLGIGLVVWFVSRNKDWHT